MSVWLVALGAATGLFAAQPMALVDQVVAELGSQVITYSELYAETQLTRVRAFGAVRAETLSHSERLLRQVLSAMVKRSLLLGEVSRLKLREPTPVELDAALTRLRLLFNSPAAFERFLRRSGFVGPKSTNGAPADLVAVLREELKVQHFLDVRVALNRRVSETAVRRCFERQSEAQKQKGLDRLRPIIERQLQAEGQDRLLRELLEQLSRQNPPRYTRGFRPPDDPPLGAGPEGIRCRS